MTQRIVEFLRENKAALQFVLSVATIVLLSVYFLILTPSYAELKSLPAAVKGAGWHTLWVVGAVACAALQLWLSMMPEVPSVNRDRALDALLEITARAIAFPQSPEQRDLRVFYHLVDRRQKMLIPQHMWCTDVPEDVIPIPLDVPFIISGAFKHRRLTAADLPPGDTDLPPEFREMIRKQIKSVLAAPICDLENVQSRPIGTISIDSGQTLDEAKLNTPSARHIINLVARCIYYAARPRLQ
jgi:hypothetical protein